MPCIYAHNSFGKEVQKILPKPLKNTIRRHPATVMRSMPFLLTNSPSSENLVQTLPPMPICAAISVILC